MDKDITVAVVMGGPSAEEQISLSTGHAMAEALRGKGYQVKEIRLVPHNFFEQVKESGADVVVIANCCTRFIWRGRKTAERAGDDRDSLYRLRSAGQFPQHE